MEISIINGFDQNRRGNGFRVGFRRANTWQDGRGKCGTGSRVCHNFKQSGNCKFGSSCKFSHDLSSVHKNGKHNPGERAPSLPEESPEQRRARADYNAWRRIIKTTPRRNDEETMKRLWSDGLDILNDGNLEWQQMLPRDLDNDDYRGREHIKALLDLRSRPGNENMFISITHSFLSVITHTAFLDCLSVDTYVGALYNFVSGANGNRAIDFFLHLSQLLSEFYLKTSNSSAMMEGILRLMPIALRELLCREPRARFNENITSLLDSMEKNTETAAGHDQNLAMRIALDQINELRAIVARANGLLSQTEDDTQAESIPMTTYPRTLVMPRDRHDNDKLDIIDVKIFPTSEEITSDAIDFLPSTDLEQAHYLQDKVERHIDTCFRLLRHDTLGELKSVLGSLIHAIQNDPTSISNPKLSLGDFRAFHYPKAYIQHVSFNRRHGLEMEISFRQIPQLLKKSPKERQKWWQDSKRLGEGILLSFLVVHDGQVRHLFFTVSRRDVDSTHEGSLTKKSNRCNITSKLVAIDQTQLSLAVLLSCKKAQGVLLEFPGIIPATFVPILQNLQGMQKRRMLPFKDSILPEKTEDTRSGTDTKTLAIPAPLYARHPGFIFNLKSILKPDEVDNGNLYVSSTCSPGNTAVVDAIESRTGLDHGQSQALVAALTREFALIQGPPGTGKSYLGIEMMKVLMECKSRVNLGPVVVVCYTNHALDQFLEHLIDIGIKKTIRIGGQSHSTVLEQHNLRKISQVDGKTRSEGFLLHQSYEHLEKSSEKINNTLNRLDGIAKRANWHNLRFHLEYKYRRIHDQFNQIDAEGFEIVGSHPFDVWLPPPGRKGTATSHGETKLTAHVINLIMQKAATDVYSLSQLEKQTLVDLWIEEIYENDLDNLYEKVKAADSAYKKLADIHDEVDRRVLQAADVIGITTTGLAKRISVLQRVQCKIVICEEAGEVMEPHMISALLPTIEHLIQIGDHQQLRPQINNYGLSLESKQGGLYQLDRSQFERLSVGQAGRPRIPVAQLNVQRRMRPEISRLIRETIYPKLTDHDTTIDLPNVVGMQKNVFWLDHDHFEDGQNSEMTHKSHSNIWEAEMIQALVRHIVRQGVYKSSDIAVLTPYTGQLQKLRAAMRNDFEIVLSDRDQDALDKDGFNQVDASPEPEAWGLHSKNRKTVLQKKRLGDLLRVATVDNFQGEEAKVIIVSLVRSNDEKRVGFLRTTNRINVLLSRAQHGMYLIGNTETYSNIGMWQKVINMLRMSDSVGTSLGLNCPRHPETEILVCEPHDFPKFSPEGGCRLACNWRLPDCGHMCHARCHSESMHNVFLCPQPCQRLLQPCGHACQKPTCGEDCGKCQIKLKNVPLPCGHVENNVFCYKAQNPDGIFCSILVDKPVPACNHTVKAACSTDVTLKTYHCPTLCATTLPCGHLCSGTCSSCSRMDNGGDISTIHEQCTKRCGRKLSTCNHYCRKICHGKNCGPCLSPCEVRCQHSKCTLSCHEPCAPCVERCTWECEHRGRCTMPCSAPCNRLPCDKRCSKLLPCGHQCPSVCGEACPVDYCYSCGSKTDARVDLLEMKTYSEIDVDDTPIVVLGCGHFFTAESLDGLVGMNEVYTTNRIGEFAGLADISGALATKIPKCPDCQQTIMQYITQRYNRVINRAVMDEMSKRFLVNGKDELQKLEKQVENLRQDLDNSRRDFNNRGANVVSKMQARYQEAIKLQKKIKEFLRSVADRHQPANKLHEAIIHASKSNRIDSPGSLANGLDALRIHKDSTPPVERDKSVSFGGRILQIKLDSIVLEDKLQILNQPGSKKTEAVDKFPGDTLASLTKSFMEDCALLMHNCVDEKLPKLAVEASIYFATVARLYRSSKLSEEGKGTAAKYVKTAKELLKQALELCKKPFGNVDVLKICVEKNIKLLRKEWYETVTAEELAEIKKAMVSGSGGIATHSGHWYFCENRHPFAIGECGMPMELARCQECGATIGGSNHQAVQGVTRAMEMEG